MVAIVVHWILLTARIDTYPDRSFRQSPPPPLLPPLHLFFFLFLFVSFMPRGYHRRVNTHRNRHMHSCILFVVALAAFIHPMEPARD